LQETHTDLVCLIYPVADSAVAGLPRISGGDWVEHRLMRS
jgi:hypothetical protein